jgi:hypothetical protein
MCRFAAFLGILLVSTAAFAADPPVRPTAAPATTPPTSTRPATSKPTAKPAVKSPAKPATTPTAATKKTGSKSAPSKTRKALPPKPLETVELDWRELLPTKQRGRYSPNAPPPVHGYLGEGGPPASQLQNFDVNPALAEIPVRLPGFIVPVGATANGMVREFFLVPYVGACIHVPPPPPNQMVYVKSAGGISLKSVHEAYWVTGKMRVEQTTTNLGAAAYALDADKIEQYQY